MLLFYTHSTATSVKYLILYSGGQQTFRLTSNVPALARPESHSFLL